MIEASFEAVVPKAINAEFEAIIPREKAFDIVNKDIHIDSNGRYEVKADAGTAMTQVNVEVDIQPKEFKDVNFYDYEGTILHSYTWDEFVEKNEMPPLPTHHKGLVCQEWNYTLEEVLEQGGRCDVGAIYDTEDGSTHIFLSEGKNKYMILTGTTTDGWIDWGNGERTEVQGDINVDYEYNTDAREVIIGGVWSKLTIKGYSVIEVWIGSNVPYTARQIEETKIEKISLHRNYRIDNYIIYGTNSLRHINSTREHYGSDYAVSQAELSSVSIVNRSRGSDSYNFRKMKRLHLPTNIQYMSNSYFQGNNIKYISVSDKNTLYRVEGNMLLYNNECFRAFGDIVSIPLVSTTLLGRCFYSSRIKSINIPDNIISISANTFNSSKLLKKVLFPRMLGSIGNDCFYKCTLLGLCDFRKAEIIPTLANTDAFAGTSTTCKIVVPDALYDQWIVATNWAAHASRIVKASEFVEPTNN